MLLTADFFEHCLLFPELNDGLVLLSAHLSTYFWAVTLFLCMKPCGRRSVSLPEDFHVRNGTGILVVSLALEVGMFLELGLILNHWSPHPCSFLNAFVAYCNEN